MVNFGSRVKMRSAKCHPWALPWLAMIWGAAGNLAAQESNLASRIDFDSLVRPILEQHCAVCHGEDLQEGGFRVDSRAALLRGGGSGEPAVLPGNAAESHLIKLISGEISQLRMPRDAEPLSPQTIDVLRRWIETGAEWPGQMESAPALTSDHWSLRPVMRPAVPAVTSDWPVNPIDAFIVDRLQSSGLTPSPPADRATLIRRMYLDMLGLPPTPAEVDAFVTDDRPDAVTQRIEQVLANPAYGERWARHWLDVVRFAESNGFETNHVRDNAYPYRDYVIAALNADKPYDQFIREQLAGDLLGQDAGTGFLVGGPYDIVKSPDINLTLMQRQDELADMVNTTATTFLGLTVGCARCHNHKFDPILQRDYYALQAVFAGVKHGERPVAAEDAMARRQRLEKARAEVDRLQSELGSFGLRPPVNPRENLESFAAVPARYVRFTSERTNSAEPCIDELEIFGPSDAAGTPQNLGLASHGAIATASGVYRDGAEPIHRLEHVNDGQPGNARSWIAKTSNRAWVQIELPTVQDIHRIVWSRDRLGQYTDRLPIDYQIEIAVEPDQWTTIASSTDRIPPDVSDADLRTMLGRHSAEHAAKMCEIYYAYRDQMQLAWELEAPGPPAYVGTFESPPATHRLYRGDPLAPREVVPPDALTVMGSLGLDRETVEAERRRALAEWIASPQNPLTARVMVNRIWHYHFGTGLVDTPSDFGAAGTLPSHPTLLDWLASEFVAQGWSLKQMHRLILNSKTYQQASFPRADAIERDAQARLLWRFPPRRLEAEAIRDCVLAVSGELNLEPTARRGPGFLLFDIKKETVWHYFPVEEFDANQKRRMVFMTKLRQEQDDVFGALDCPDGNQTMPRRNRSTTPLQALNLFNSPFMQQQAAAFAQGLELEFGADRTAAITQAFRACYARPPTPEEVEDTSALIDEFGWPAFCRALLNSNEFLFIQ